MTTWLRDDNGNKCSVEYFGTAEAAQKALDSLRGCENCVNCSRCLRCSGCSECSDCWNCSDCLDCWNCSDCSCCSGCCDCSYCSHRSGCYDKQNNNGGSLSPPIPKINNIHQAVYAAASQPNALDMDNWHNSCGSAHCRAGWVVHLAGDAGYELERFHGVALAAQLIYRESDPTHPVSPVRFYETSKEAIADMNRLAEIERGAA